MRIDDRGAPAALLLLALVALALAFWPRYLSDLTSSDRLLHLHAGTATAWIALLGLQATLAARGHVATHRRIGRWAPWLAVAVTALAIATSRRSVGHGLRAGVPVDAETVQTFVLSIGGLTVFVVGAAFGWWRRHDPRAHRSWMLLSGLGLLGAAIQRLLLFYVPGFGSVRWSGHGDLLCCELLCLLGWRGRGSVQARRPFAVGLALFAVTHVVFAAAGSWAPLASAARWWAAP
ncbi:MAG: hypothetical protein RIT45_2475 [Pseudomonadota bacterium]